MKRIDHTPKLKLLFKDATDNPPYYDPNDLHAHVWKTGKLGLEDNPKIQTFATGKLNIMNCVYCKICHTIRDPFQSTISEDIDTIDDVIKIKEHVYKPEGVIFETSDQDYKLNIEIITKKDNNWPSTISDVSEKLFHEPEGIFKEYAIIE